jgi:hypothetical protein
VWLQALSGLLDTRRDHLVSRRGVRTMLELCDGTALGDETGRRPKLSEADTKCNPSYKNRILTLVSWSAVQERSLALHDTRSETTLTTVVHHLDRCPAHVFWRPSAHSDLMSHCGAKS